MNFWNKLFGSRSKPKSPNILPPDVEKGAYEGVFNIVSQHKAKMAELDKEEDKYWETKKAQLASSPNPPDADTRDKNHLRAKDLATIAEYHFKCGRFDQARENYDRASLLTEDDANLSKKYKDRANAIGRTS